MKTLLIALCILITVSQAKAQVQPGIQDGQTLDFSSRPLSLEQVKDVRKVSENYNCAIHIDVTVMTGVKTKGNIISHFVNNGDLFLLESATQAVWNRGAIGMGIRKNITLAVPCNQFEFNNPKNNNLGILNLKNDDKSFAKISYDFEKEVYTIDLSK